MSQSEQKVVQSLNEAHATELGLVRVLESQIAMTPRCSYRSSVEKHLRQTRGQPSAWSDAWASPITLPIRFWPGSAPSRTC